MSGNDCKTELTWDYINDILEQLTLDRIRFLSITGGEPLLHPQIRSVLKKARKIAEHISLSTNATLITQENFPYLSENIDTINISLDAPRAEIHDRFRNKRGCFEKAKRAIRKFANKGVQVVIQTTIFRENLALLCELGQLIQSEGASSWSVRLPLASGRALLNPKVFFSKAEIREVEEDNVLCMIKGSNWKFMQVSQCHGL